MRSSTAETGERFDVEARHPLDGHEEVLAPSGRTVRYAYHDQEASGGEEAQRVYVEQFMIDARMNTLFRAGYEMALIYGRPTTRRTPPRGGDPLGDDAQRGGLAGHRQPQWNSPKMDKRLREPDFYEWFSFVLGDRRGSNWYVNSTHALTWPARYFDLIRDSPVWEVGGSAGVDPRDETAEGLLHVAA